MDWSEITRYWQSSRSSINEPRSGGILVAPGVKRARVIRASPEGAIRNRESAWQRLSPSQRVDLYRVVETTRYRGCAQGHCQIIIQSSHPLSPASESVGNSDWLLTDSVCGEIQGRFIKSTFSRLCWRQLVSSLQLYRGDSPVR